MFVYSDVFKIYLREGGDMTKIIFIKRSSISLPTDNEKTQL